MIYSQCSIKNYILQKQYWFMRKPFVSHHPSFWNLHQHGNLGILSKYYSKNSRYLQSLHHTRNHPVCTILSRLFFKFIYPYSSLKNLIDKKCLIYFLIPKLASFLWFNFWATIKIFLDLSNYNKLFPVLLS